MDCLLRKRDVVRSRRLPARITVAILALASVAVTSCSEDDDSPLGIASDNTTVRVVNALSGGTNLDIAEGGTVGTSSLTTGAGNWDIYVNPGTALGTPAATVVGRNKASPYLTVLAGQATTIRLTNAGSTTTLQDIPVPSLFSGTGTTIVVGDAPAGSTQLQVFALPACA